MARKLLKINKLRKKAQNTFNRYIRLKDRNPDGLVQCVTCGEIGRPTGKPVKMNAGHFIHGLTKLTTFEESNLHVQCVQCNKFKSGSGREYTLYMIDNYGREEIERLETLSHVVWKPTRDELEAILAKYQGLLDGMGK